MIKNKFPKKEQYRQIFAVKMIRAGKTIADVKSAWGIIKKEKISTIEHIVFETGMFRN